MRADFLSLTVEETRSPLGPAIDPTAPKRFFNRELSWLSFNWRVLEEASNPSHPLFERVRFLSISASNLDEFYMVRVAGLIGLVEQGVKRRGLDGLTPSEELREIEADARRLMVAQQAIWERLKAELHDEGVEIVQAAALTDEDRAALEAHFLSEVFPVLTPLTIDPAHPFPFIPNKGFALAVALRPRSGGESKLALFPIPSQIARFVKLPTPDAPPRGLGDESEDADAPPPRLRVCALETLLKLCVDRFYPADEVRAKALFRILRDSDIEIEEEAEDLVAMFETALKRRRRGDVVRLKIEAGAPEALSRQLIRLVEAPEDSVIAVDGIIGVSDLDQLIDARARPDLCWPSYTPRMPERLRDYAGDIFGAIREKDILLQHPYESFEVVVRFLQQAAQDPNVIAIRQTLYRTSKESPIVAALVEAAEAGKSVTALVELKARFDEAANIRLAKILERAGCQVVYGFVEYKTHAKMSTVVRREDGDLVTYSHFGTGNYHPITAKVYTDLSLFTCDARLARDAVRLFNYVGSYAPPERMEALEYAPITMKRTLLALLDREVEHAEAGRPAQVWAKMNALIEPDIIDALYRASQAGVRIDLVVRGICGLRPGVEGLSENIRVKSVVGRFLEHSRVVCFGDGEALPHKGAKVYISSADWMDRNLSRRVETLTPIMNETVRIQILEQVMAANLADEAQSWVLQPDGAYVRAAPPDGVEAFSCHTFFMTHPSLSGRGERGAEDAPRLRPHVSPSGQVLGAEHEAPSAASVRAADNTGAPSEGAWSRLRVEPARRAPEGFEADAALTAPGPKAAGGARPFPGACAPQQALQNAPTGLGAAPRRRS